MSYFTLKDSKARINCVMEIRRAKVTFTPVDGMELLATGHVLRGSRANISFMSPIFTLLGRESAGIGFPAAMPLEAEGLFKAERKKLLPVYPAHIALITSRQTAALQDMFKVLRRYRWVRLFVYHVPVQGDDGAEKKSPGCDNSSQCVQATSGWD